MWRPCPHPQFTAPPSGTHTSRTDAHCQGREQAGCAVVEGVQTQRQLLTPASGNPSAQQTARCLVMSITRSSSERHSPEPCPDLLCQKLLLTRSPADLSAHKGLRCSADSKSMGKSQHHTHCTGLRSQETYAQAIQVVSGEVTYVWS